MSQQSEVTRSQSQTGLVTLSKDVILKEQDHKEVVKRIAYAVNRLGKLFQIPGWSEENAVILAEWIYDNYKYESLEAVEECLRNPPETFDEDGKKENNWRLTPDRIQKWMAVQLEKEAIKREKENEKLKEDFKEELPVVDYEKFKMRLAKGEALKEPTAAEKSGFTDEGYRKFKEERLRKQIQEKGKPSA